MMHAQVIDDDAVAVLREQLRRCAVNGTVVGSVASTAYLPALLEVARGAREHSGFACVATSMMDTDSPAHELVLPLPRPTMELRPRQMWCGDRQYLDKFGWRRSHFFRVFMWYTVLRTGFDLLAVDCDWRFIGNPLPAIHFNLGRSAANSSKGRIDVTGWYDGFTEKLINVGLIWVRSTADTIRVARNAINRTNGAWEQAVFNEELAFRSHVPCCHCSSCLSVYFSRNWTTHNGGKGMRGRAWRKRTERRAEACDGTNRRGLLAAAPPPRSTYRWLAWRADTYNELPLRSRTLGRCTGYAHKCLAWEKEEKASGRMVIPPRQPKVTPPKARPA